MSEDRPRVLVMGLGGIGGIISAHLLEQGIDVVPVSTNKTIRDTVSAAGFWASGDGETRIVPGQAYEEPPLGGRGFDCVARNATSAGRSGRADRGRRARGRRRDGRVAERP